MSTESRGITGIKLRNIGKFETFALELREGDIVELQGDNNVGKSTIPLVIESAIFGTLENKSGPNNAAPDGEGTMTVNVAGFEITRVVFIDKKGEVKTKSLEVLDNTGSRPYEGGAVQRFLNQLFPKGSFLNPFLLQALPKREQIAAIVKALPIDLAYANDRLKAICQNKYDVEIGSTTALFDFIERITKDFKEDRLVAGRNKDTKETAYKAANESLPEDYDPNTPIPVAPPAMQDIYDQKAVITRDNIRREELARAIVSNTREIQRLEEMVAEARNAIVAYSEESAKLGPAKDTIALDAQIADHRQSMDTYQKALEVHGDRKRRHNEQDVYYAEWQKILATHADLDGRVKALAKLPAELFSRAELPIQGMYIEGDTIMLPDENGELRPAEEFGDAALLDLYIALAMTLAPIPVILADGLERCGPKRSQEIYDRIRAKGFQLIGTRVTEGPLKVVHIPVEIGGKPDTLEVSMEPEFDFEIPEDIE